MRLGRRKRVVAALPILLAPLACTERVPTSPTSVAEPASCTYEISPASRIHGAGMENGTVSVTAPSGCTWSATTGVNWISVTSNSNGTGNGTVGYAIAANNSDGRTGTMTVAGRTFTVEQARPGCALSDIADVSRWSHEPVASAGLIRISGQQVEVRVLPGSGLNIEVVSPCALQGDFDVQIDYALITWPAGHTYASRLQARLGDGVSVHIQRNAAGNYSMHLGPMGIGQRVSTSDTRGQLRLARTGAAIAGFFSSGSGWTGLGVTDAGTAPVRLSVGLASAVPRTTPSEVVIRFENLRINVGAPAN